MRLSQAGKDLIKGLEQLSLVAYWDAGQWSIGYGHSGAYEGQVITKAEAERLFARDVTKYETAVNDTVSRASQQQFDAMVSLAWNIGVGGFANSTVARLQNAGDTLGAANAFRMWNQSEGAVNPVLVRRRERERNLYLYGVALPGVTPDQVRNVSGALGAALAAALVAYVALPRLRVARRVLALA